MRTEHDLSSMAVFIAAVEAGSFSAAATKLGLTPSGVSKLVARLEDRLGARLLQRTTRRMQLTQVGAVYFERARRILDEIDALEREVEGRGEVPRGTLRVSAPVVLGHVRVLPLALSFQRAFPEVKLDLVLEDRLADLVDDNIDVAIRMTRTPPLSSVARKLDDDTRALCASPDYLARRGTPKRPGDLADHDCLVFVTRSPVNAWRLLPAPHAEESESVPVSGRLQVNNTLSLREAALSGLGIADLPRYLVEEDLEAGRLATVLADFVPVERAIYAVYAPAPFVPARLREFVKHLAEGFAPRAEGQRRGGPATARPSGRGAAARPAGGEPPRARR